MRAHNIAQRTKHHTRMAPTPAQPDHSNHDFGAVVEVHATTEPGCPLGLTAVSVQRVIGAHRHIKAGRCSAGRVAHFGMTAAWNGHAADDGAGNLRLRSRGGFRVTLVVYGL